MKNTSCCKVLLVDDEQPVREMFEELLKRENCLITSISSGEEAIQKVQVESFDLVFLDIKLGGISGIEVLKNIKEIAPLQPVVMTTGFGEDEDLILRCTQGGANGYIGKNLPIAEIISKLRHYKDKLIG